MPSAALAAVQEAGPSEGDDGFVVGEHFHSRHALRMMAPNLDGGHNGLVLLLRGEAAELSRAEPTRMERYRVPFAMFIGLSQRSPKRGIGHISLDAQGSTGLKVAKEVRGGESAL